MPLHNPVSEKIESITYNPGLQNSGDLESATRTITATSEASGLVNADYSKSLTLPKPGDTRLTVLMVAARLAVTIDTIPAGDTNLYCRVYVDAQDASHLLFDKDWTTTGDQLDAVDTHSGAKATIFNLLKDGQAHTFYFFFWKAGTGTGIVISVAQLWQAVGASATSGTYSVLDVIHSGFLSLAWYAAMLGTGALGYNRYSEYDVGNAAFCFDSPVASYLQQDAGGLFIRGDTATSIAYLDRIAVNLRSEG